MRTSRRGTRLNCWNTIAQLLPPPAERPPPQRADVDLAPRPGPAQRMRPPVGSTSRLIMRSRVDLPAPDRPMIPSICPRGTWNDRLSTATSDPNAFVSPEKVNIARQITSSPPDCSAGKRPLTRRACPPATEPRPAVAP